MNDWPGYCNSADVYDDEDFKSSELCCLCGGGSYESTGKYHRVSIVFSCFHKNFFIFLI